MKGFCEAPQLTLARLGMRPQPNPDFTRACLLSGLSVCRFTTRLPGFLRVAASNVSPACVAGCHAVAPAARLRLLPNTEARSPLLKIACFPSAAPLSE